MRRLFVMLLAFSSAFTVSGCGDFDVVDTSKNVVVPVEEYKQLKVDTTKDVVISKAEYEQLKTDAALAKQVGRYQIDREGIRTWRLDTATGRSCLLLASEADWKKPNIESESCAGEDANAAP
jgi:hypothetical protein